MVKKIYVEDSDNVALCGSIELTVTPKDMAAMFKNMTKDEKALFFEELHKAYKNDCFSEEIKQLTKSRHHSLNGKWMMREIGLRSV